MCVACKHSPHVKKKKKPVIVMSVWGKRSQKCMRTGSLWGMIGLILCGPPDGGHCPVVYTPDLALS